MHGPTSRRPTVLAGVDPPPGRPRGARREPGWIVGRRRPSPCRRQRLRVAPLARPARLARPTSTADRRPGPRLATAGLPRRADDRVPATTPRSGRARPRPCPTTHAPVRSTTSSRRGAARAPSRTRRPGSAKPSGRPDGRRLAFTAEAGAPRFIVAPAGGRSRRAERRGSDGPPHPPHRLALRRGGSRRPLGAPVRPRRPGQPSAPVDGRRLGRRGHRLGTRRRDGRVHGRPSAGSGPATPDIDLVGTRRRDCRRRSDRRRASSSPSAAMSPTLPGRRTDGGSPPWVSSMRTRSTMSHPSSSSCQAGGSGPVRTARAGSRSQHRTVA